MAQGERAAAGVGLTFLKLGAGEAIARIVAFGATVYVARTLGATAYGVVALATAILLYLSVVTDAGIEALGIRDVAANRGDLFGLLPEILGARFLLAVALVLLTAAASRVLPQPERTVLVLYSLTLLTVGLGTRWVHLGLEQTGRAGLARVLSEGISAFLIVIAVRTPEHLVRVPVAQFLGELAGAWLLLRLLPTGTGGLRVRLRPAQVTGLLSRSWPMVLHALLGLAIFNSDFIFLRVLRDSTSVGYYAAAYTLVSFFLNLATAYSQSLIPALTRLGGEPERARGLYHASMAQVVASAIPVTAGGILVADPVVALIFGTSYAAATAPLVILLLLLPFALVRSVAQGALLAHARQHDVLRSTAWAAATNLALNFALIPRWGMGGAAWATVVTEVVRCGLAVAFTRRLELPMPPLRRFRPGAVAGAVMALAVAAAAAGGLPVLVTIAIGAAVYVAALTALGGIRFRRGALPELTV